MMTNIELQPRTSFLNILKICNDKIITPHDRDWLFTMITKGESGLAERPKVKRGVKDLSESEMVLVEFRAPRKLVNSFDLMLKLRFSTRSEALRSLMRTFVEEASLGS